MVIKSPYPDLVVPDRALHEFILQNIPVFGDNIALIDNTRGISLTFKQLADDVRRCAVSLHRRGLEKGDVVAICSSNRNEYPVVLLAISACGAIASPFNPRYQKGELRQLLELAKPFAIFCDVDVSNTIEKVTKEIHINAKIYTFGNAQNVCSFEHLINDGEGRSLPRVSIDPKQDVCLLPFSSGTTGLPKGVMLTHRCMIANILQTQLQFYLARNCVYYNVLPVFHTFAFSHILCNISRGSKFVFDVRFNEERMFLAFQTHRITHFSAVPPMMIILARSRFIGKYDTSSLKRMICGAAPIAPDLVDSISRQYNLTVSPSYGLTEMVPLCVSDPLVNKMNSAGTISPNTFIKIVSIHTREELGPGEKGEILAKGPQMMKGYFKNPEATARTIDKNEWFYTGDIGYYDEDGMLYVEDRLKELIKYKGFQIAPAELEATLLKHPGIADVAVIGIPDFEGGEVPKAFVVKKDPNLSASNVMKFIESELSNYKHLRGGVQFVDTIPKSPSGKILRRVLRKKLGKL